MILLGAIVSCAHTSRKYMDGVIVCSEPMLELLGRDLG